MQVPRRSEEKDTEAEMETLELKTRENIKVLNRDCMESEIKDNLPVMSGMVGDRNEEVLRESGCNGVIVKRELSDDADYIGEVVYTLHDDCKSNA